MIYPKRIEEWKAQLKSGADGLFLKAPTAWEFLAERKELLALLREVEWVGKGEVNPRHCPVCLGLKPGDSRSLFGIDDERDGHAPDCRLAAMLKG